MSVHRAGGGGGGGSRALGFDRRGSGGGSGKFKARGGSGKFKAVGDGPPGLAKTGGIPPGQLKKMGGDNYEDGNSQGTGGGTLASVLGAMFSSTPQQVTGTKATYTPPSSSSGVDLGNTPQSGKAPNLPYINQYNPVGKDSSYTNGAENCGPAILAMIAKSRGQTDGLTDAQLINKLGGVAGTTGEGTSGNGMIAGLESLGMQTSATAGADLNWINTQLAQGHTVMANGDFYSVPGREDPTLQAGHYIAVTGVSNGVYSVTDPADQSVTTMTAQQLGTFIASHPESGFAIAAW